MKVTMRFDGGKELATALGGLSSRMSKSILIGALREAGEPMRDRMQQNAPVSPDAPHLRDTITISTSRGQDAREAAVAVGATKFGFYGSFQEFGTAHHAAQPWARPAFEATHQECLRVLSAVLWRELAGKGIHRASTSVETTVQGEV